MSAIKVMLVSLMGPKVSKASGMKSCVLRRSWYFLLFLSSAISSAAPDAVDGCNPFDNL